MRAMTILTQTLPQRKNLPERCVKIAQMLRTRKQVQSSSVKLILLIEMNDDMMFLVQVQHGNDVSQVMT